ncbi:MAG: hypothetical protein ACI3ZN_03135 [Candidatus Cryptobacteroides sp.]
MRFLEEEGVGITVWGWNKALKNRLLKEGVDISLMPSDSYLNKVRELSHRRLAVECNTFLNDYSSIKAPAIPMEMKDLDQVRTFVAKQGRAVLKAPWSGSGKGIRWISDGAMSVSDEGWCRNILAKQGSIIGESRKDVVLDFALLFKIGRTSTPASQSVSFEGYSLFETSNGTYHSNILASDEHIRDVISGYISLKQLDESKDAIEAFLKKRFCGQYQGYLGVDMFIYRSGDSFLLNPCVEINVRITMGLLARRYYDLHFAPAHPSEDGLHRMSVIYAPNPSLLRERLNDAVDVLSSPGLDSLYAVAVF